MSYRTPGVASAGHSDRSPLAVLANKAFLQIKGFPISATSLSDCKCHSARWFQQMTSCSEGRVVDNGPASTQFNIFYLLLQKASFSLYLPKGESISFPYSWGKYYTKIRVSLCIDIWENMKNDYKTVLFRCTQFIYSWHSVPQWFWGGTFVEMN